MNLEIQCGHCGKSYGVPDRHAGKQVQCPNCRQLVAIPRVAYVEPEPVAPVNPMAGLLDEALTEGPRVKRPDPWNRAVEPSPDLPAGWPSFPSSRERERVGRSRGRLSTRTIVLGILLVGGGLLVAAIAASVSFFYTTMKNLDTTVSPKVDAFFAAIDDGTFGDLYATTTTPGFRQRVSQEEWNQLAAGIKLRLGHLETKTRTSVNLRQFNSQQYVSVAYSATFEKGSGTIQAWFERSGEDWGLEGFVITSPELLKAPPDATCPHCGKTYTLPAKFCPACGKPIPDGHRRQAVPADMR